MTSRSNKTEATRHLILAKEVKMFIHEDGLLNVSEAIIKQARKDFIKGGKILYGIFGRIPTQKELFDDELHKSLANNQSVRWMYDSWRFVVNDPYEYFGDVGDTDIINTWKREAIEEYYKELYLKGAEKIYISRPSNKKIHLLSDEEVIERIGNDGLAANFIKARNYIYSTPFGDGVIKEWNIIALKRSKHSIRGAGRVSIQNTNYHKEMSERRVYNIKRAKEMYEEGMLVEDIGKELGVTRQCVMNYLRS